MQMEIVNENEIVPIRRQSTKLNKENRLAQQLYLICNSNGKEIDLKRSAPILHDLGKEYQTRSPDKFNLLKSAALYNAALVRSPDNSQEIESDLKQLCKQILSEADAKKQDVDLVAKSREVKITLHNLRMSTLRKLSKIKQIPDVDKNEAVEIETVKICDVRRLQEDIATDYIEMMADIAAFCEDVMGEAPFTFAIAGMGSLARKEITPYSDFEHIILLPNTVNTDHESYEQKLEYYRWFSVIFQTIVINLQETILPSVAISSLNDKLSPFGNWFYDGYTPRGIAFDGMMLHACKFPLGRQEWTNNKPWKTELIKPIDEMLKYLESEESLKNGYHLSDILTKTCFVYKDKVLFEEYEKGVCQKLKHEVDDDRTQSEIKKQVSDDLKNFAITSAISHLKTENKFNVKHMFYRSITLFVSAMGRMYNVQSSSCFDIVEELARENIISEFARHLLMFAVALACEVRLRWYMDNKSQSDEIFNDLETEANVIVKLFNIIGKTSTIKYFHIAYALQCDVAKRLKLQKHRLYSNPILLNLSIGHSFDDREYLHNFAANPNNKISTSNSFLDFDESMAVLTPSESDDHSYHRVPLSEKSLAEIQNCGNHLFEISLYEEALECFEFVAERLQQKIAEEKEDGTSVSSLCTIKKVISYNSFLIVRCLICLKRHEKASSCLKDCIQIFEQFSYESTEARYWIGRCFLLMKQPQNALDYFKEPNQSRNCESRESIGGNTNPDLDSNDANSEEEPLLRQSFTDTIATFEANPTIDDAYKYYWIGISFLNLKESEKAVDYFERALRRKEQLSVNVNRDNEVADILKILGCCLMNYAEKLKAAITYFERSLQIKQVTSQNIRVDHELADTEHYLGKCLMKKSKYENAISHFQTSLQILERLSLDVDTDKNVAEAHNAIGDCLLKSRKAGQAIEHFHKLLQIKMHLSSDVNTDSAVAHSYSRLGVCYFTIEKPREAIDFFKSSLQIQENIFQNTSIDREVGLTSDYISRCLLAFNETQEAMVYLQRSIQIYNDANINARRTNKIFRCLNSIAMCVTTKWCCVKSLQFWRRICCNNQRPLSDSAIRCSCALVYICYNLTCCIAFALIYMILSLNE